MRKALFSSLILVVVALLAITPSQLAAQQTLGGITGVVSDASGNVIPNVTVNLLGEQTSLTRVATTNDAGGYTIPNLPIGTYTLTFTGAGFDAQKTAHIAVQANRTATVNAVLNVGQTTTTVEVEASPLMNSVDTTVGYVLDKSQIDAVPLATGSFTGLAILSPGVNAELLGGTGSQNGLGNQPIWANGQRDTSNTFLLNGVDASNLFNGKSTSSVGSNRLVNNTGGFQSGAGGVISSGASVYLAIGQSLPTPPPDTLSEVRVNSAMYDAQQGSTSGAHIDMSTASGTNAFHGSGWFNRGTNFLNAAPFFFKNDASIPDDEKNPQLHRWTAGFTAGGPIIKDKLFAFGSYQQVHVSDRESGISHLDTVQGLTDDRSASTLADLANANFGYNLTSADVNPVASFIMNYKLPDGSYMIPNPTTTLTSDSSVIYNSSVPGTSYFFSKQAVADVDWIPSSKDTLAFKYYYQADPGRNPYAYSSVAGWTQRLDAGSQVLSINNTWIIRPNLSTTQTLGFIREKEYGVNEQPFAPSDAGMSLFGSPIFPGISIVDILGENPAGLENRSLNIGAGGFQMGSYTGVFQNRLMPSANAIWTKGRHTVTFGGSFAYSQLNIRNNRSQHGDNWGQAMISVNNFADFLSGGPLGYNANYSFATSAYLVGDANRYLRAPQVGSYLQDKFQVTPTLSISAGIRYDWNGAFSEKYGRLYNFEPSLYVAPTQDAESDQSGFIFPSNYKYKTPGVSKTTLTGRQWGIAPRIGFAWNPKFMDSKLVIRGGTGMYYDRGELFSYLSPGYASGAITGGPFGVSQAPPFVKTYYPNSASGDPLIPNTSLSTPFCDPLAVSGDSYYCGDKPAEPSGTPASLVLPSISEIAGGGLLPTFAVYDRKAKLPYTMNFTLDVQFQPSKDLMIELGYVGNLGRHQVIPLPFNQAHVCAPGNADAACHGEQYTYGYWAIDEYYNPLVLPDGASTQGNVALFNFEGGNVDMRVPYIGYSAEAEKFTAAGISAYHALQSHVEKRLSHGLQAGVSYTYSHGLDEQSAMGLFYNGNNPLNLRDSYASADFDRTHVINFNYVYHLPPAAKPSSLMGKVLNDWTLQGITVLQSGQPYSMVDFSGSVGSIFYSTSDGITNPILPLAQGYTPKSAMTGHSGAFGASAFKPDAFTIPDQNFAPGLAPGGELGVPPCGASTAGASVCDVFETTFATGQRNIFRQAFQKRADISLVKTLKIHERFGLKYSFDVYNVTNTSSFDIPSNEPNLGTYNPLPAYCGADAHRDDPGSLCYNVQDNGFGELYPSEPTFGYVHSATGSARQIQMTLHLTY
ncbi:MAG TPA: carboxypeptidase-like regulatory domain-containing protein [Terracidiphilus sp.]